MITAILKLLQWVNERIIIMTIPYPIMIMIAAKMMVGWLIGGILSHVNPCALFNAKSCLYI